MFTSEIDYIIERVILIALFCIGLTLLGIGLYSGYWIFNELFLVISTNKLPASIQAFLTYINQQNYDLSGITVTGQSFSFSIGSGIIQWLYAFLAILLVRFIPEIIKILISSGTTVILDVLKWFGHLEKKPTRNQDDRNL